MSDKQTAILVLNAGSSSIKFSLFNKAAGPPPGFAEVPLVQGAIEGIGGRPRFAACSAGGEIDQRHSWPEEVSPGHEALFTFLMDWIAEQLPQVQLLAAGHRVVHGGMDFDRPRLVDKAVMAGLEALIPLAPLHQPHNLAAIRALQARQPTLPQIACFDTAFHRSIPEKDQLYGLPRALAHEGLRRYGFHGLSYEFIAAALPRYDGFAATGRAIVAHLGNGASLCALRNGRSQACTMGFSTLEGLIMGTRSGSVDPGLLLYLMREKRMDAADLEKLLYKESGLLGLSGVSSDMRDLLASNQDPAREAVDLFCDRVAREAASLVAVLGGIDALVFTGGIGERSASVRSAICRRLTWLGLVAEESLNDANRSRINTPESSVGIWIIPTNEELMIARHCRSVLAEAGSEAGIA